MSHENATLYRSPVFLRLTLGLIYFLFGVLKFFPDLGADRHADGDGHFVSLARCPQRAAMPGRSGNRHRPGLSFQCISEDHLRVIPAAHGRHIYAAIRVAGVHIQDRSPRAQHGGTIHLQEYRVRSRGMDGPLAASLSAQKSGRRGGRVIHPITR